MKKTVIFILAILPIFLLLTISFLGKWMSIYSYIPVENHQVQLRSLISVEEAEELAKGEQTQLTDKQKSEIQYVLTHKSR